MANALEVLGVLLRWVHMTSVAVLVGGVAYARLVEIPVLRAIPAEDRLEAWRALLARYAPLVWASIAGLLISGFYRLLAHPGHSRYYNIWFGVKMLLAAHVFAAAALAVRGVTKESEAKLPRRLDGILITGALAILVADYLGRIF